MFCGYCGNQNLDEHIYCVGCGRRLKLLTKQEVVPKKIDDPKKIVPATQTPTLETQKISLYSLFDFDLPETGIDSKKYVEELEKEILLQALKKTGWVKNQSAMLLRINRTTLLEKLKKYEIKNE
jgi:DNA-binding NtrC family response regulator